MIRHRISLRTADITILEGLSSSRASEVHAIVKASLKKAKYQKVTIREYCKYKGFNYKETLNDLGLIKAAVSPE